MSRAIHLEIVSDLSVESFLLAFRRFVGRQSTPKLLISDNGSTYLAAAEDLKRLSDTAASNPDDGQNEANSAVPGEAQQKMQYGARD